MKLIRVSSKIFYNEDGSVSFERVDRWKRVYDVEDDNKETRKTLNKLDEEQKRT